MQLMQAQTEKTKAEAENIAGGEKEKLSAETQSILQGITNQKTQNALMAQQKILLELEELESNISRWDRMHIIQNAAKLGDEAIKAIKIDNDIYEETKNEKIEQIKLETTTRALNNILIAANIGKTKAETKAIAETIAQDWTKISQLGCFSF